MPDKSLLDGVKVNDKAFPLRTRNDVRKALNMPPTEESWGDEPAGEAYADLMPLVPAGSCPGCGAPVYGPAEVRQGDGIRVRHSCDCRQPARPAFDPGQTYTK